MGIVLAPALLTFALTLVRLAGELQRGPAAWFNSEPGGYLAVVGIVWLVHVCSVHFALKLANAGERPERAGRAVGPAVVLPYMSGLLPVPVAVHQGLAGDRSDVALAAAGVAIQIPAWPAQVRLLVAYA